MNEKLKTVGLNLLPTVAYGDALGLPVEKKTAQEIAISYGQITELVDITENPFIGRYPAGTWSDDTQLSMAVAQAIVNAGEFNMESMVASHINALESDTMGWGKSTQQSAERLRAGVHWTESGNKTGEGNGVLMKMAPLVYWQEAKSVPWVEAQQQVDTLTRMTHDNDLSVITARTHAEVLRRLLRYTEPEPYSTLDMINQAVIVSSESEIAFSGEEGKTTDLLDTLSSRELLRYGTGDKSLMIDHLTRMKGFHSSETLAMAYGAFCIDQSYPGGVIEAVNLGGDTDSIGSIVAVMTLFNNGDAPKPIDHEKIDQLRELEDLSRQLAKLAVSN